MQFLIPISLRLEPQNFLNRVAYACKPICDQKIWIYSPSNSTSITEAQFYKLSTKKWRICLLVPQLTVIGRIVSLRSDMCWPCRDFEKLYISGIWNFSLIEFDKIFLIVGNSGCMIKRLGDRNTTTNDNHNCTQHSKHKFKDPRPILKFNNYWKTLDIITILILRIF